MTSTPDFDPFEEHNHIDQEMKNLQAELLQLCKKGLYDEAERRAAEELRPLSEKWTESLYQSFVNLRNHPNFYQPK